MSCYIICTYIYIPGFYTIWLVIAYVPNIHICNYIYTPNCLISSSTVGGYTDLQKVKWWTKHNDWPISSQGISPTVPVGFVGVAKSTHRLSCFFSRRNGWLCHLGVLVATPSATQNSGINWFYSRFFHTPPNMWDYTGHEEWTIFKNIHPSWLTRSPLKDTTPANLRWVPSPPWWRHWNNGGGKIQHEHDLPWGYNHPISFLKQDSSLESSCWVVMQHDPFPRGKNLEFLGRYTVTVYLFFFSEVSRCTEIR